MPLLIPLTFLRPIVIYIVEAGMYGIFHIFDAINNFRLVEEQIKAIQIIAIFLWAVSRFITAKMCLQSFLNRAVEKELESNEGNFKKSEERRKEVFFTSL